MKIIKNISTGIVILFLVNIGCTPNENVPMDTGTVPEIIKVTAPEKWNSLSASSARIEAKVSDPQGQANIAAVTIALYDHPQQNLVYSDSLYDDGSYYHPRSGDVLGGDGVFCNTFLATEIIGQSESIEYTFRFIATDTDGNVSQVVERPVIIGANSLPAIIEINAPDSLSTSVIQDLVFTITVADSDGIDDITHAWFESKNITRGFTIIEKDLYNDGDFENHGDVSATDAIFSTRISEDFVRGKIGDYDLIFHVTDSFGDQNPVDAVHRMNISNQPAEILEITIPKTIQIPIQTGTYHRELLTARVSDADGLADIDSVYFYSRKPDGTMANNGLPIIMVDNGLPFNIEKYWEETGDLVAGDGIYSFSLLVMDTQSPGEYTFSFYVRDKAGNRSEPVTRTVGLIGN
ncbi:MAG: hypothetical protein E4H13_01985 [Calditrichales bacterium]|nr:MAG: hypothetical protein E4H13_01985 [Calditrichales bacterium]